MFSAFNETFAVTNFSSNRSSLNSTSFNQVNAAPYPVFFKLLTVLSRCKIVIGGCGIPLNILCVWIWSQKKMRSAPGCLHFALLAIYDLIFLVIFHIKMVEYELQLIIPRVIMMAFNFVLTLSQYCASYTTIVMSLDRSVAVTRPFKWHSMNSTTFVRKVATAVFVWSLLLTTIYWVFQWKIRIDNFSVFSNYMFYVEPVLFTILPFVVVTPTSIVIYVAVKKQRNQTAKMTATISTATKKKKNTDTVTTQVLLISVVTVLSNALYIAQETILKVSLFDTVDTDTDSYVMSYLLVNKLSSLMFVLNASINCFLFLFGSKFRTAFNNTLHLRSATWSSSLVTTRVE